MNDLDKALGDISSIRRQMARSTEFRGYGPATLAATGVFAMFAAVAQAIWMPDPAKAISAYLVTWISTAAVSAGLIATKMRAGTRRIHWGIADELIGKADEQYLPSAGAGKLLTLLLVCFVDGAMCWFPCNWQV